MKPYEIAYEIISESRRLRETYKNTNRTFDKIRANMYTIFECYAAGLINWKQVDKRFKTVIKEYVTLHSLEDRKEQINIMKTEYNRVIKEWKPVLDQYKAISEQKLVQKFVNKNLSESVAKNHSKTYYNSRALTNNALADISKIKTWNRVMESYPNLTVKDEARIRMLTIFEGPTVDTTQMITTIAEEPTAISGPMQTSMRPKLRPADLEDPGFEFNPNFGHRDQPDHPENRGLTPSKLAPSSSPRPKMRPANLQMRRDINKAVQQAVASEGKSPHKKGTAKYKAHMAAMHAEGYKVMPPMDPKYVARSGLEGPFTTLSGKVVYYDPKEGKYYDPDTDIYMTYDEFQNYDKDYSGMKDERDDVKEEMSDEQIDAFHTALDTLVHKHLGHSSDERDEVEETLSPEEKKQVNQMYNKDGTMTDIGKKVMSQGQIQDILKKAMKQLKGIDAQAKFTHRDLNQAVATINQGNIAGALQELVNGVDGPEPQIQDTFNDAHDDLQRLINPKTDKELDDEYWQDVSDMKAKSRAGVESIVQDVLNNALEEMTSAGAFASVAAPMSKMKRRKDSIFADKENNQTAISEAQFDEAAGEKDACYHKVKSRYKVWPSAYASGALVKCRKVGAKNWGNSKK